MAYARIGERGSAIYLWTDGEYWFCDGCALSAEGDTFAVAKKPENFGLLGYHLLQHVAQHQHVPAETFERIRCEMEGIPFTTDVMLGIIAESECECRTPGCGHLGRQHNGPNGECEVCQKNCWS